MNPSRIATSASASGLRGRSAGLRAFEPRQLGYSGRWLLATGAARIAQPIVFTRIKHLNPRSSDRNRVVNGGKCVIEHCVR